MKVNKNNKYYYRIFLFTLIFLLFSSKAFAKAEKLSLSRRRKENISLQNRIISLIDTNLTKKMIRAGIYAVALESSKVLVDLNADEQFIPASNQKLFTSAAALAKLGPDFTFPTIIYANQPPVNGSIAGSLYIKGFGDPFLVTEELCDLANQIKSTGIKNIQGDLIYDDSYFAQEETGMNNSAKKQSFWYNAESCALSINFNTIAFSIRPASKVGHPPKVQWDPPADFIEVINKAATSSKSTRQTISITRRNNGNTFIISGKIPFKHSPVTIYRAITNPSQYAGEAIKDRLTQLGIRISGKVKRGIVPEGAVVIYRHQSRPLAAIITSLNKISNNFIAQQILKTMGAQIKGNPGTDEKGVAVIKDFMQEAGICFPKFCAIDGCGLSKENSTTPKTIVNLLTYIYQDFEYQPEFLESLAIGGVDGTLRKRMKDPKIKEKVRAKTGLLNGVSCLSGYAYSASQGIIAFSILMNGPGNQPQLCKKIQDEVVALLLD